MTRAKLEVVPAQYERSYLTTSDKQLRRPGMLPVDMAAIPQPSKSEVRPWREPKTTMVPTPARLAYRSLVAKAEMDSRPCFAFALLLYTGQRRSDIVRMGSQHLRDGVIEIRQVKTGAELFIPLHTDLAELIALVPNQKAFRMTEASKPFTPNGFYMRFTVWVEAAGLPPGRSPHGLRKTAARLLAEAGCSAHLIASISGHKTLSELQRYTRAADQVQPARDAVVHIGRPVNKAKVPLG